MSNGLGVFSVKGRNRLPCPPARIITAFPLTDGETSRGSNTSKPTTRPVESTKGTCLMVLASIKANSSSFDVPAGDLSGERQTINVRTTALISTAEAFEALGQAIDAALPGAV